MVYTFSENIQRGILYLYKNNKDFHGEISHLIKPEYFEFIPQQKIYSVIRDYYDKYKKLPTNDFILEEIKKVKDKKEELWEYQDEIDLIDNINTSSIDNPEYYLELVEEFARKQSLKEALQECVSLINSDNYESCVEVVRNALNISRTVDIGQDYFAEQQERWQRDISKDFTGKKFKAVFNTHNKYLEGGNSIKELAMVAAPPGVGKSLYLVNQAVRALAEGYKVLYVSLEMSEDKIAKRFDSVTCGLPVEKLKEPATQLQIQTRLSKFLEKFPGAALMIKEYAPLSISVNSIRSLLVQLRNKEFIPDLIIVDYLELLQPCRRVDQEYIAQQNIATELRGLAVETNTLVWTATQTNRQGSQVNIIDQTEMAGSFGKMRPVDFAISLNQTEEEYDNGRMRVFVMKARDAKQKYTIRVNVDYSTLRMTEITGEANGETKEE